MKIGEPKICAEWKLGEWGLPLEAPRLNDNWVADINNPERLDVTRRLYPDAIWGVRGFSDVLGRKPPRVRQILAAHTKICPVGDVRVDGKTLDEELEKLVHERRGLATFVRRLKQSDPELRFRFQPFFTDGPVFRPGSAYLTYWDNLDNHAEDRRLPAYIPMALIPGAILHQWETYQFDLISVARSGANKGESRPKLRLFEDSLTVVLNHKDGTRYLHTVPESLTVLDVEPAPGYLAPGIRGSIIH